MELFKIYIPERLHLTGDIHFHIHQNTDEMKSIKETLLLIKQNQITIMTNEEQALADLEGIKGQLVKIGTESSSTLAKVAELEAAAQNAGVSQALLDKIAEVKAQAQIVDDLVPDPAA